MNSLFLAYLLYFSGFPAVISLIIPPISQSRVKVFSSTISEIQEVVAELSKENLLLSHEVRLLSKEVRQLTSKTTELDNSTKWLDSYNTNRDKELEIVILRTLEKKLEETWEEVDIMEKFDKIVDANGNDIAEFDGFIVARKKKGKGKRYIFVIETKQVFDRAKLVRFNEQFSKFELVVKAINDKSIVSSNTKYNKMCRRLGPHIHKKVKLAQVVGSPSFDSEVLAYCVEHKISRVVTKEDYFVAELYE